MIDLYLGGSFDHRHEVEQFNEILSILMDHENQLGNFCVVFGCAYIGGEEIDCVIFKDNAIIAIEMKDWKGHIYGAENGDWKVNAQKMKNVFHQSRSKRYALIHELNECFNGIRFDVCVWAIFGRGANCSSISISEKNGRWFRSLCLDDLSGELILERSPNVIRKKRHLNSLISKLNLRKKDPSDWIAEEPDVQLEDLRHLFPNRKGEYNEYVFKKNFNYEYVIRYPCNPSESESIVMSFIRNKVKGTEYLSPALRLPFKTWEEVENYILKVQYSWEPLGIEDIYISGQENIVRVGPLKPHGYDGIQIEVLKDGTSLPSPKRIWFNMGGVQQLQEIILERRNG